MLSRLTKSAEAQAQVDDEYFKINTEGHQARLKLENTLRNCHQARPRPRICTWVGGSRWCGAKRLAALCVPTDPAGAGEAANRGPVQHPEAIPPPDDRFRTDPEPRESPGEPRNAAAPVMTRAANTDAFCRPQGQRRIEQAVQRVDEDKDMQVLVEQSRIKTEDTRTDFLMTDYFVSLQPAWVRPSV